MILFVANAVGAVDHGPDRWSLHGSNFSFPMVYVLNPFKFLAIYVNLNSFLDHRG